MRLWFTLISFFVFGAVAACSNAAQTQPAPETDMAGTQSPEITTNALDDRFNLGVPNTTDMSASGMNADGFNLSTPASAQISTDPNAVLPTVGRYRDSTPPN